MSSTVSAKYQFLFFSLFVIIGQTAFYLYGYPLVHASLSGLRLLCCVAVWAGLFYKNDIKFPRWILLYLIYFIYQEGIAFYLHANKFTPVSNAINIFTVVLLFNHYSRLDAKRTISVFASVFALIVFLNIGSLIVAPDGIFNGKYLIGGNYNQMGIVLLCAVITNAINYQVNPQHRLLLLGVIACSIGSTLLVHSMTPTVGLAILYAYLLLRTPRMKRIALIAFVVCVVLFLTAAVFLQKDLSEYPLIVYIVETVLQKNLTFTSRLTVWTNVLYFIEQSWLIGYGTQNSTWFENNFGVTTAHNIFYQQMIEGGIIQLGLLCIIIISVISTCLKNRRFPQENLLFGICVVFLMMGFESYPVFYVFYLFMLVYSVPTIYAEQNPI